MAKSHPYGNGGLNNVADFSQYDPEKIKEEIAYAEMKFAAMKKEDPASAWALVMSKDIIQWNNNLLETSRQHGYNWDLSGVSVIRMTERTARRAIADNVTELWVILADMESVLAVGTDEGGERLMLSFELEEDAGRFTETLRADGNDEAAYRRVSIDDLKRICEESQLMIGLVPGKSLVVPTQFERSW